MTRTVRALIASGLLACGVDGAAMGTDAGPSADASSDSGESSSAAVPLACDGSLCDTTNDSTCTMSRHPGSALNDTGAATAVLGVLAACIACRRRTGRLKP